MQQHGGADGIVVGEARGPDVAVSRADGGNGDWQAVDVIGAVIVGLADVERDLHVRAEVVVHLAGGVGVVSAVDGVLQPVINVAGECGQRQVVLNFECDRIDAAVRNDVSDEGRGDGDAVYGLVGGRVIDGVLVIGIAESVRAVQLAPRERAAEITLAVRKAGHRDQRPGRGRLAVLAFLKVEEEEGLVVAVIEFGDLDRTAEGRTKVVLVVEGFDVDERFGGVERVIRQVFPEAAVELVGSGAGCYRDHAALDLAVFGGEVTGLERKLLHHFDRRRRPATGVRIGGILAIHQHAHGVTGFAVDPPAAAAGSRHARGQNDCVESAPRAAADSHRQIDDGFVDDVIALFGAFGFEEWRRCVDGNGLGDGSDLEGDIDAGDLGHVDLGAGSDVLAEAGGFDRHFIVPGGK